MRYLKRLIIYIILFFLTYSVSTALLFRFIPVTVTPLKVVRLFENLHEEGLTVHSNWVPLKKINPTMVQAVVATEDNNYLTHNGFDWEAINQALDEVADQNIHPVSVEFRLLTQEIRLGVPLEQALENMNRRLGSEDFELVATAILTARQTGGELTGTLERVAALIRERVKISNKVRALTAMGRLQALVIALMPFVLMFMMSWASPALMDEFYASPLGIVAVIMVVVLDVLGFLWIRKITTIDV